MAITAKELEEELQQASLLDNGPSLMDLVHKYRGGEKTEDLCTRFLAARKGDRKKSVKMIRDYLDWCEKDSVLDIRHSTAHQMLRADTNPEGKNIHDRIFPHGYLGKCKEGRPVLYQLYGTEFCAKKMEDAGISGKDLADYYTWMLERTLEIMGHEGQWVIVVDLNGWNLGHLNMRHLRYVRAFVDRISAYYPERAGKIFLINVPSVFSKCWALIKPMLDQVTQNKVALLSSSDDWQSVIAEVFDLDLLPEHLGGQGVLRYDSPHTLDPQCA